MSHRITNPKTTRGGETEPGKEGGIEMQKKPRDPSSETMAKGYGRLE